MNGNTPYKKEKCRIVFESYTFRPDMRIGENQKMAYPNEKYFQVSVSKSHITCHYCDLMGQMKFECKNRVND